MTLRSVLNKFRTCAPWRDESGVALVALVFVLGSAALVTTTMVLLERTGIQAELEATRSQRANYEKIQAALEVYALRDFDGMGGGAGSGGGLYRLPCPADSGDDDGVAEPWDGSNTCGTENRGIVPWVTIGLSESDVIDARGNYITYIAQQTTMEACNGVVPTSPTLTDDETGTDYNYALIGHGENGLGAFRSSTNAQATAPATNNELRNCGDSATLGQNCSSGIPDANGFTTGPASDDSTDFFDDIVRAVDLADSLTAECEDIFGEPETETAFQGSMTPANAEQNLTRTLIDMANNLGTTTIDRINDLDDDQSNDTAQVYYVQNNAFDSAACAFYDPPVPIRGHTFRYYTEFSSQHDPTDVFGNGGVFAVMSYDNNIGGLGDGQGYTLSNSTCGGTSYFMGFADDQSVGTRVLPSVPRLGIEVDTMAHYDGVTDLAGEGSNFNRDNFESPDGSEMAWNHVAILGSNNDHVGTDQTDTGDVLTDASNGDGPLCLDNEASIGGFGDDDPGDTGENDINDLTGCYPASNVTITDPDGGPDIDVGIIEVANAVTNLTADDFHQMRVDMTYEGGSCGTDEIYVQYWLFLSDGTGSPQCESGTNCQTLSEAFVADGSEDAAKEACIPWSSDIQDDFMRFGFTFGQSSTGAEDYYTINDFQFFAIANSAAAEGTAAAATDQSREVHNVNAVAEVVDEAFPNSGGTTELDSVDGLLDIDDLVVAGFNPNKTETGIRIIGRNGTFGYQLDGTDPTNPRDLHNTNGIGMRGIGNVDTNEVDMLWLQTTTTPSSLGVFPNENNPEFREAMEVRFYADDGATQTTTAYERVSLNLGNFSTNEVSDLTGDPDVNEEVLIRAFRGGNQVGTEQVIEACTDGDTSNSANSMFLSLDFTGTPVDRIIIIPNYLDAPSSPYIDEVYGSSFYLRGVKGCGTDRSCGLTAPVDCVTYQGTIPTGGLGDPETIFDSGSGSGLNDPGVSGLVTLNNVQNHFNNLYGTVELIGIGTPSNTVWQNLEGFMDAATDSDDGPVFMDILPDLSYTSTLRFIENNTNPQFEGISVTSGGSVFTDQSNSEELNFIFQNDWETALVSIAGFGTSGTAEQVIVQAFQDGVQISDDIIATCNSGNQANVFASLIFDFSAIGSFDRLRIAPTTRVGGTGSSSIIIHGIRTCTVDAACDFTDFGSIQGIGTSNCEETHVMTPFP